MDSRDTDTIQQDYSVLRVTTEGNCALSDPLTILATVSSQHHHGPNAVLTSNIVETTSDNKIDHDEHEASIEQILSEVPADKPYVCAICLKGYDHPVHLQNHERTHIGEKPYQCDECGRQFGTKAGLEYHKEAHLEPSVFCDVCKKGFASQKRLDEHSKSHVYERAFICDVCGKSFKSSQGLHAHIKLHTGIFYIFISICI